MADVNTTGQLEGPGFDTLSVVSEVASYLAAGLSTHEIIQGIGGTLKRKLPLSKCVVWVRTPAGDSFSPVVPPGEEPVKQDDFPMVRNLVDQLEFDPTSPVVVRNLVYEEEYFGVLHAEVNEGVDPRCCDEALSLVAKIVSPLLGTMELSEDLASEIALRTREIEDQRRFMSKILDSLPHGMYVIDRDYTIQAWNQKREAGTQGVDREHALGRNVFDVLHRQPRRLLKSEFDRAFETGAMAQMEVESDAGQEVRHYRINKIPMRLNDDDVTHVITIGEDITEGKRIREQVAQTEKLAAVGQLAAGVMHEINNPLATIGACIEALTLRLPELPPSVLKGFEEYMGIVDSELDRCRAIIDGLLDFSRPRARIKNAANINQIVEDAIFLAKHHQKFKRISLSVELGQQVPDVMANAEQLIQAFLALMINSIDAMEGVGSLVVSTYVNPLRSGEVVVEFQDTGPGISGDDISKIFEPFFTTKEPGAGTGLGLSICYGIIQQHSGVILVESQVGKGATFKVVLPVSDEEKSV